VQEIDQKAAIMLVIEHVGEVPAGTRCSAVLFDAERIRREKEFHARLYRNNGIDDPEEVRRMINQNVRDEPYWLVSLKLGDQGMPTSTLLHRVDVRSGKVLDEPEVQ
jgi:hypothetical protein